MASNKYCVIMAGGIGSRFWPKSRQSMPKQFLDILGTGKSFIRHTYERFAKIVPAENFLVVTNHKYKDLVLEHIPEIGERQVLCEPIGRNTAPCIAYAAYTLLKQNPDAEMIVTPADHLILNEEDFRQIIGECLEFADPHDAITEAMEFSAETDAIVTLGIRPDRPETGYGYIEGDLSYSSSRKKNIFRVDSFKEKPALEVAQEYIKQNNYFWNSGIFIWKVQTIVEAFRKYLPEHHAMFSGVMKALGTDAEKTTVEIVFSECRAISIDYGIMEKADNVYVRCGDFGWSDVGTWGSVYQHSRKDRYANAVPEQGCYLYDTRSSIVSLPKDKVAVISGLKEYIVVDTDDVLMICPRSEEQNIKKFIDEVKFNNGDKLVVILDKQGTAAGGFFKGLVGA